MNNYAEADSLFKEKQKDGAVAVTIAKNTLLVKEDKSTYGLTFSGTPIIKYYRNGAIKLIEDDCGTTVLRTQLNKYTPDCIHVVQRKFRFYVEFYDIVIPLNDALIFNPEKMEICDDPCIDLFFGV